ncbi:uncharacterized protein LOC113228007 isoform X2 [Hyposmocoma kahamanoa]|uniref:uncharacterized protein LOC113228007 isoform X2 n=1 Tax=Hyposmocoma kahamanoa TaxID=1477025 RepID=UPI000E6D61B7|nr:uncharacterized protein LOC113228007 isoform X2 [Hyposmocoma kahamanoa]
MNSIHNTVYTPGGFKYAGSNSARDINQKNFMNGLQNACKLLSSLERSLHKTKKYEKQLVKCHSTHSHTHSLTDWWDSEISQSSTSRKETTKRSTTDAAKPTRSQVDVAESWSTMSIVCLQYQYEELSKRYETLLRAYDDRCNLLNTRDATLSRLRQRARMTHARLTHAHQALLSVGEKFLALRDRRIAQCRYEEKIFQLKSTMRDVMAAAERARLELDSQIADTLLAERDSAAALLLAEVYCRYFLLRYIIICFFLSNRGSPVVYFHKIGSSIL